jgi:hypothetical protein
MVFQDDDEDDDHPELEDGAPPDADVDDDESSETESCPHCGKPVYEQADACPHCRNYISRDDSPSRKPLWIIIGTIVTLAAIWYWIL